MKKIQFKLSRNSGFLIAALAGLSVAPIKSWANVTIDAQDGTKPISETVDFGSKPELSIPESDNDALKLCINAIKKKDIGEYRRLLEYVKSPNIKAAIVWRASLSGSDFTSFQEKLDLLNEYGDFPDIRDLRIQLEKEILDMPLSPQSKIDFLSRTEKYLQNNGPISGEGQMALAKLLRDNGQIEKAKPIIAKAFANNIFDAKLQTQYIQWFDGIIDVETFDKRADLLLWLNKQSLVKPLLSSLSPQMRINANIRMGLANDEGAVISGKALDDRGIIYERVKTLRKQDLDTKALDLLLTIKSDELPDAALELLWEERRRLLIEAIKTKRYQDAFQIISTHNITSGPKQAEAELMSAWVALRLVDNPQQALKHLEIAKNVVSTPATKAKAFYWLGRTYEALNSPSLAKENFDKAAMFPTYYYGQLASARMAAKENKTALLTLPPEYKPNTQDYAQINQLPMIEIAHSFLSLGERELFGKFVMRQDDYLTSNEQHQTLAEIARNVSEYVVAMRVAKSGMFKNMLATEAAFPIISIPKADYEQAEIAFSHAIIRQETEFNPSAKSKVGALGLMQFMPATAAAQARKLGIPHQTNWLVSRPEHSLLLGSTHLADLVDKFYGSYVLTIVGYNAGPNRSLQWINTYGEIRGEDPDKIIDWVEMIPFTETREYVQKVLENLQVYRTRLYGDDAGIQILNDLSRGQKPPPVFKVVIPDSVNDYKPAEETAIKPTESTNPQ